MTFLKKVTKVVFRAKRDEKVPFCTLLSLLSLSDIPGLPALVFRARFRPSGPDSTLTPVNSGSEHHVIQA